MKKIDISRASLEQLYVEERLKTAEVARQLGVSQAVVSRRLREYSITTRTMADYYRVNIPADELRRLYWDQNLSPDEIAPLYHCAPETILHRIHQAGIPLKPIGWKQFRRYVPDTVLAAWPSPGLAYVIGIIASDGNLRREGNVVHLASVDQEIIKTYTSLLQIANVHIHVHHTQHKDQYMVAFADPAYRAFLEARGLTPYKSTNIGPLDIPDGVFPDFARGCLDGDGCWSIEIRPASRSRLSGEFSSGSLAFLKWMRDTIYRLTGLLGGISGIHLRYRGPKAKRLGEWLYYQPNLPCLSRKRATWDCWREA
jgi:hypothetical protein